VKQFRWILSAAIAAYACHLAVQHATPIDRALPLLGVAVTVCAAVSYPAVMVGVLLLIVGEIAIAHEVVRLMAFGLVCAGAVASAMWRTGNPACPGQAGSPVLHSVAAVVLLRWIPLSDVLVFRELLLIGMAVLIVLVLGRTPFAVAVAVITAFLTPAIPLRTLAVPLLVLGVCIAARVFGMPALRWTWVSSVTVSFLLLFFAWSGVVARSLPFVLRKAAPEPPRVAVGAALAPEQSVTLEVPEHARSLIVSGANVARFRRGRPLGRIEPGAIDIRLGDAADWGAMRREQVYGSHNPWPRDMAGRVRGYGYNAWLDGAGRVALPQGARTIIVTADGSLPVNASLQVEGFE
jgi:hypothetical protein